MIQAELEYIVGGLEQVIRRWTALAQYIDDLLVEADFMRPRIYEQMLFDDDHFTRSRKYFWAIACLTEFDISA